MTMMQLPMMLLLACILSVTPSNAFWNDNHMAGRFLQQPTQTPEPENEPHLDDDSSTVPFTHPVSDYYTNPYFKENDNDDNGSGEAIVEPDPTSSKLSSTTIVWISAGTSVVVLLSLCIWLGAVNRKRNHQRVQESMRDTMTAATTTTGNTTAPRSSQSTPFRLFAMVTIRKWCHYGHNNKNDNTTSHDNVEMAIPCKSVEKNHQNRYLCDTQSSDPSEKDSTTSTEDV